MELIIWECGIGDISTKHWQLELKICQCGIGSGSIYCLQFYVRLGLESPLNERQIMEDRLFSGIGSMPQTWPR